MKRYKLFTHGADLDGASCAILADIAFLGNVDVEYCNYNDIDDKLQALTVADFIEYEKIFITDISCSFRTANIIETALKMTGMVDKVVLLDHHKTALELNIFDWANVITEINGEPVCGTRLFLNYLNEYLGIEDDDVSAWVLNFVEVVNRYDTWLWKTKYDDELPGQLNQLFYLQGRDKFISEILDKFDYNAPLLEDMDLELLREDNIKKDNYIKAKDKYIISGEIDGFKIGLVFAEQYISELGNELSKKHPELDMIAIYNNGKISLRTVKDNVDCSEFASRYGGGGHIKAAGMTISETSLKKLIKTMFI